MIYFFNVSKFKDKTVMYMAILLFKIEESDDFYKFKENYMWRFWQIPGIISTINATAMINSTTLNKTNDK